MRKRQILMLLAVCVSVMMLPRPVLAGGCDSDIDGNTQVDVLDLLAVLGAWGPCVDCPEDVDGNGSVDVLDLLKVLADWGPCLFDYGPPRENAEAEQIGLEMLGASGPLIIPDAIYNRVDVDLELIRADQPDLLDEAHTPAWAPNDLIIKKIPGEPMDEYEALNVYYQVVLEDYLFGDWYVLTFAGSVNVPALALIYAALDSIEFAEPNGIIGGENFWTPTDMGGGTWQWHIDDGFWDCFDGCDCHREYVIETESDGTVNLISYEEWGAPWCEF